MSKLLGIDLDTLTAAEHCRLEFLQHRGMMLFAIGLALLIAYAFVLYRLRPGDASKRSLYALSLLRGAVFACLLFMLLQPALVLESEISTRRQIALVVDNSASMGVQDVRGDADYLAQVKKALGTHLGDHPEEASRLDLARAFIHNGSTGLTERLRDKFDMAFYSLSDKAEPRDQIKALRTSGKMTHLGDGLVSLAESDVTGHLGGIILLSDGQSNAGRSIEESARRLAQVSIPVWCVGIGRPRPIPDIEVIDLVAPAVVADGSTGQMKFTIRRESLSGPEKVTVKLDKNGTPSDTTEIQFEAGRLTASGSFEITAPEDSQDQYKVYALAQPDEINTANNAETASVQLDASKKKVLYIEGRPRWQFRYLKNGLIRDDNFEAACILQSSALESTFEGTLQEFSQFPDDPAKLAELDVIILGDVNTALFSTRQLEAIRDFVDKDAGGLVIAAGTGFMPQTCLNTAIEPLIPLEMKRAGTWTRGETGLKPRENHPLVMLAETEKDNQTLWETLPKIWHIYTPTGLKSGARCLLETEKETPVVVYQPYGLGRCVFIGTDGTWRWRYRINSESANKHFWRFWRQTLLFASGSKAVETRGVNLETDKKMYEIGEHPKISLRLRDDQSQPILLSQVSAQLNGQARKSTLELALTPVPGNPGLYRAEVPALGEGKYQIRVQPKGMSAPGTTDFTVRGHKGEFANINLNRKGLETLSTITRGGYFQVSEAEQLLGAVTSTGEAHQMKTMVIKLWHSPILIVILLIGIGGEWILRKIVKLL